MATTEPLRTPEQMEWIRERFKPDGLRRLAFSTADYYEQKEGSYLPDVAALAYEEWARAEDLERELRRLLWLHHGCEFIALYGDDGEMSCGRCFFDFKRQPIAAVRLHVLTARAAALEHVTRRTDAGRGEGAGGEGDEYQGGGVHGLGSIAAPFLGAAVVLWYRLSAPFLRAGRHGGGASDG